MKPASPLHTSSDLYRLILETRRLFHVLAQASSELNEEGITASLRAVMEELYPEGQLTVPEIARRKKVTRQHIQQIANQLLVQKLALFVENPAHKRSPLLQLSPLGVETFGRIVAREEELLAILEEEFASHNLADSADTLGAIRRYFASDAWQQRLKTLRAGKP